MDEKRVCTQRSIKHNPAVRLCCMNQYDYLGSRKEDTYRNLSCKPSTRVALDVLVEHEANGRAVFVPEHFLPDSSITMLWHVPR